jgi:hypothetical protein
MAVSELEKNAESKSRLPSRVNSCQRGASSKGGETSCSYRGGHVEEVFLNWQALVSNEAVIVSGGMVLRHQNDLDDKLTAPVGQNHGAEAN